jgi:hypothetical protein
MRPHIPLFAKLTQHRTPSTALASALSRAWIEHAVRCGQHLGAAPYGHRVTAADQRGPAPSRPRVTRTLTPDLDTAEAVPWIFHFRASRGLSHAAIARELAADTRIYPEQIDPTTGARRPWTAKRVRAILANPVYTGHQVWGRTRDGRPLPPSEWVLSPTVVHEPLITRNLFLLAQPPAQALEFAGVLGAPWPTPIRWLPPTRDHAPRIAN